MNRQTLFRLSGAAILVAAAGGYYVWQQRAAPPPAAPHDTAGPRIDNPLPAAAGVSLPTLADSDEALGTEIAALVHSATLPELFYPTRLARRFVATVDNLPREQVAATVRLLRPPVGAITVGGEEPSLSLAPDNSARYAGYLRLLQSADTAQSVTLYRKFYPL